MVSRLLFATTTDRVPAPALAAVALAACAVALATISAWAASAGLFLGAAVLAVGSPFLTPAFYRVLTTRVAAHNRGSAFPTI